MRDAHAAHTVLPVAMHVLVTSTPLTLPQPTYVGKCEATQASNTQHGSDGGISEALAGAAVAKLAMIVIASSRTRRRAAFLLVEAMYVLVSCCMSPSLS